MVATRHGRQSHANQHRTSDGDSREKQYPMQICREAASGRASDFRYRRVRMEEMRVGFGRFGWRTEGHPRVETHVLGMLYAGRLVSLTMRKTGLRVSFLDPSNGRQHYCEYARMRDCVAEKTSLTYLTVLESPIHAHNSAPVATAASSGYPQL